MLNNDVLRSLRYTLDISDAQMVDIIKLSGKQVAPSDLAAMLKKEDEEGFTPCDDELMAHFLDGLVFFKRGKDDSRPAQPLELPVTNNMVLKKLRVAFELKEDDMHTIMNSVDCPVSKPEMSALFRKFGHSNYRTCGDQFLRNFLKGLTLRVRG
ncbi:Uncharacterized conserved protein YehS, DUF1456 family [Pseudomonas peli]|jgi:uncharacterized protein YehS (DUF1456 family)|uniref:Uncharacterized conserved protein YehS, DUF1456 family n=1 Tax=Pseudomonas peli TaxID=592361 RepID=A0AB37Z3E8_9PSED|nr:MULTISPECIES: DUF1456 family protein [Pseudomonas]OHC28665.1 MAG: hypothetical protein A3J71_09310 [Pseudomonadales bacterium RIFCSPHIGHO2_02_FULL_60_43]MDR7022910.1 uncharacterized protein YehS (DUF1456 family) [Pseudomonas peli]NMY51775.1 DUF1456 family protein [Pseudomonas sp. WS 5011]NMZ69132.1 DUF1456 family protein [Pseudomonas peli]PJE43315.1 MAG: DUF1456 domain-containing protein [Pseudomonas sp.] [Pseudomonas sp. FEMGT703P]|tara:strand:- start:16840 stop:17301 length:462 start_codon:yes stop_codon:yes gene_type:complete